MTGVINAEAKSARPAPAVTVGYLHQEFDDYIVIATTYFTEPVKDEELKEGDYTALPKGMIKSIELL